MEVNVSNDIQIMKCNNRGILGVQLTYDAIKYEKKLHIIYAIVIPWVVRLYVEIIHEL